MLNFVFGSAGSGKTTYIGSLLKSLVAEGLGGLTMIVPEQFSFESEKQLLRLLGVRDGQKVEVTDFTRLAKTSLAALPGASSQQIDDAGRAMMMSVALEQTAERLTVYGKFARKASMVAKMLSLSGELKQCAVYPEDLQEAASKLKQGLLKGKLCDIALIMAAYDALVAESFSDPRDELTKYAELLPQLRSFCGKTVFIDGFRGFTAQEMRALEQIMLQSENVYVALCTDGLYASEPDFSVFAHVRGTARKLKALADKNGVRVSRVTDMPIYMRSQKPELNIIEKGLFVSDAEVFSGESENVTLYEADDAYDECDFVALSARKLMREENYRCREIAVIARTDGEYSRAVRAALKKYGVPVFEDKRVSLKIQPLIVLVRSALEIAASGFATDAVLRVLKTELFGLSVDEVSEIENYVFVWNINGSRWLDEWSANPSGLGSATTLYDKEKLKKLNSIRQRIVLPLRALREKLKSANGEEIAKAVFAFLKEIKVSESLFTLAEALEKGGEKDAVTEQNRIYDTLIGILDQTASVLSKRKIDAKRYLELFELVLSVQNTGAIPQGLDEIIIGSADRTRAHTPRAVFVVGANEGVFPLEAAGGGVLTDSERGKLAELGVEVTQGGEYKLLEERFIIYNALCSPSEKLCVSFCKADFSGSTAAASEIVSEVRRLVPGCRSVSSSSLSLEDRVESAEPAFELAAELWHSDTAASLALKRYFSAKPEYSQALEAICRAADGAGFKIENGETATQLFGKNMFLSASRIDNYYLCPFQYFCKFGLKAKPRNVAQLDPSVSGTIIHFVLENMVRSFGKKLAVMTDDEISVEVGKLLNAFLADSMGGTQDKSHRFVFLYKRLKENICEVIRRLSAEFAKSSFEPVDFELCVDDNGDIEAYDIPIPDGGSIRIHGYVDRVDVMKENGETFLRVVDYKSGTKEFRLSDVLEGLNMQMLIYLFAIYQNGGKKYGSIVPSGVLYVPAGVKDSRVDRTQSDEDIEITRMKEGAMSGIVLNDARVIYGMDEDCRGAVIPVKKDKNGAFTGNLISAAQLGALKRRVEDTIGKMGLALHSGEIPAFPAYNSDHKYTCEWCDYKTVCSRSENSPVREIAKLKNDACTVLLDEEAKTDE